jgi:hypothetical protein
MEPAQWQPLVLASVKLIQTALEAHFRPNFRPSLIWFSEEHPAIIPIGVMRPEDISEAEILHDLAVALLSASTGIDKDSLAANATKLGSWSKIHSLRLARCVDRILIEPGFRTHLRGT